MSAPNPSRLDANQVLQGAYDEATGRLRTDAQATVVNSDIDVSLDPSEDGVFLADKDTLETLKINADGSLNVNLTAQLNKIKSFYGEQVGIAQGITTTIVQYNPSATVFLQKAVFSGTNIAEYEIIINGITFDKKRTFFGASLNSEFDFGQGLTVTAGQIIQVKVYHNRPNLGDFNARIQIMEI